MKLRLQQGLAFVTVVLIYGGRTLTLEQVLVDTGSASTLFAIDSLQTLEVRLEPWDAIHRIHGVRGTEFVFTKQLDHLVVGTRRVEGFSIEVGAMEYGIALDGILGMDFLLQTRATLNFNRLTLR